MKLFWFIVALLFAAAAGTLAFRGGPSDRTRATSADRIAEIAPQASPGGFPAAAPSALPAVAPTPPSPTVTESDSFNADAPKALATDLPTAAPAGPEAKLSRSAELPSETSAPSLDDIIQAAMADAGLPVPPGFGTPSADHAPAALSIAAPWVADDPGQAEAPEIAEAPSPATSAAPSAGMGSGPVSSPANDDGTRAPSVPAAAPAEPVVRRDDGSTVLDGRFVLTGDGTSAKPYVITWDLLTSAAEEFKPQDGRKDLPARILFLKDQYVQVSGHVAFPLLVEEPTELLSMMNQWDGCCLGIPPTPYDAIEVRISKPAGGPARFTTFGTVRGRLRIEPTLVGTWLVALYAMDNASLEPTQYGGFHP